MNSILKPLARIYQEASSVHRQLYEQGWLSVDSLSKPVLSVGNISFGGTGKTPLVLFLADEMSRRGLRVGIVARSYKGRLSVSQEVLSSDQPQIYGDEASFYKMKRPIFKVFSGPQKIQSAKLAEIDKDVDVILVDDGFQHHRLFKNWNGIVIDASSKSPLREPWSSLKRAHALFITRFELVDSRVIQSLMETFTEKLPEAKPIFFVRTQMTNLAGSENSLVKRAALVSAIGNPRQLGDFLKLEFPQMKLEQLVYSDHYSYDQADVQRIESMGFDRIYTTEKDEVKLRNLKRTEGLWYPLQMEFVFDRPEAWSPYWEKTLRGLAL